MVAWANYDLSGTSLCACNFYRIFRIGSVYLFPVLKTRFSYARYV